jgi:hypothetical protein
MVKNITATLTVRRQIGTGSNSLICIKNLVFFGNLFEPSVTYFRIRIRKELRIRIWIQLAY